MKKSPHKSSKGDDPKGQLTISGMFTKKKSSNEVLSIEPEIVKKPKIEIDITSNLPLELPKSITAPAPIQNQKVSLIFLTKEEKLKLKEEEERKKQELLKQNKETANLLAAQEREARIQEEILRSKREYAEMVQYVGITKNTTVSSFFTARPSSSKPLETTKSTKIISLIDSPSSTSITSSSNILKTVSQGLHEIFNFPHLDSIYYSIDFENKINDINNKYLNLNNNIKNINHFNTIDLTEFQYDPKLCSSSFNGLTIPSINSYNLRSLWTIYACVLTNSDLINNKKKNKNMITNIEEEKVIVVDDDEIKEIQKEKNDFNPFSNLKIVEQGNYPYCKQKFHQFLSNWISLRDSSTLNSSNTTSSSNSSSSSTTSSQMKLSFSKNKKIDYDDEFFYDDIQNNNNSLSNLVLITGISSSGKTNLVHEVAKSLNLNVIEVNTSQVRSGAGLKKLISEAVHSRRVDMGNSNLNLSSTFSLILIDEVDLVFDEEDTCFHASLSKLALSSKCPIVLTAERMPAIFDSMEGAEKFVLHLQTPEEARDYLLTNYNNNFDKRLLPNLASLSLVSNSDIRSINKTLELFPYKESQILSRSHYSFFDFLVDKNLDFAIFDRLLENNIEKNQEKNEKKIQYFPPIVFNCKPNILLRHFPSIVTITGRNFLQKKIDSDELASIEVHLFPGKIPVEYTILSDEEIQILIPGTIQIGLFYIEIKIHHKIVKLNLNNKEIEKKISTSNSISGNFNSWFLVVNEYQNDLNKILLKLLGKPYGQVSQMLWEEAFLKGKLVYKERKRRRKEELLKQLPAGNFSSNNFPSNNFSSDNKTLELAPTLSTSSLPLLPPLLPTTIDSTNFSSPIPSLPPLNLTLSTPNFLPSLVPASSSSPATTSSLNSSDVQKDGAIDSAGSSPITNSLPLISSPVPDASFENSMLDEKQQGQISETENEAEISDQEPESEKNDQIQKTTSASIPLLNVNVLAKMDMDSLLQIALRSEAQRTREIEEKTGLRVRPGEEGNYVSVDPTPLSFKISKNKEINTTEVNLLEILSQSLDQLGDVDIYSSHVSRLDKGLISPNYSHKIYASSSGLSSIAFVSYQSQVVFDSFSSFTCSHIKKKMNINSPTSCSVKKNESQSDIPSFLLNNYRKDLISDRINSFSYSFKQLPILHPFSYKSRYHSLLLDYKPFVSNLARKIKRGREQEEEVQNKENVLLNYGSPSSSNNNLIINTKRRSNGRTLPTMDDPFLTLKQVLPFNDITFDNLINITDPLDLPEIS